MIHEATQMAQVAMLNPELTIGTLTTPFRTEFWEQKKVAAQEVVTAFPKSVKESVRNLKALPKAQSIGKAAMTSVTTAQVTGDDALFSNIYAHEYLAASGSELVKVGVAWGVTTAAATMGQAVVGHLNQRFLNPDLRVKRAEGSKTKEEMAEMSLRERMSFRADRVRQHAGRVGMTLSLYGVGGHTAIEKFSRNEVNGHALAWGATAPFFYTAMSQISLGALDSQAAPFVVSSAYMGLAYAMEVNDRATARAMESGDEESQDEYEGKHRLNDEQFEEAAEPVHYMSKPPRLSTFQRAINKMGERTGLLKKQDEFLIGYKAV